MIEDQVFNIKEVAKILKAGETHYAIAQAGKRCAFMDRGNKEFLCADSEDGMAAQAASTVKEKGTA